jgi:hypothetical protein
MMEDKIKQWLGDNIIYDAHGQMIFAVREDGHHQIIADVRGWGAIQNLFPGDPSKAMEFQDALGKFIAEAIKNYITNSDTARLDKLQFLTKGHGNGWILRDSTTDRGMRLHETQLEGAVPDVREAIDNYDPES